MNRPLWFSVSLLFPVLFSAAVQAETAATPSPLPRAPKRQLLFVAELCRHGDRSPIDDFPNDALPAPKWPEGVGQLTTVGMRAHYDLGQRLRARYVDSGFLPAAFTVAHVYVRSTDVDRTLMSAGSQMAGLYPPGSMSGMDVRERFGGEPLKDGEWGLPTGFQPVPVHTVRKGDDDMLLVGNACPRHDEVMESKRSEPEWKRKVAENTDYIEEVKRIVGSENEDFGLRDVEKVSDTWTVFAAHSVPLPDKATPDIVDHARNLSNWLIGYGNQGLEANRLRAGMLLHEVKLRMAAAALKHEGVLPEEHKDYAKKFILYSAHDTTVAAALAAMQVFNNEYPPYNSTLIWELHKGEDGGQYMVYVEFNGEAMLLPGCSDVYCSMYEYLQSTRDRTVRGKIAREIECLIGFRRVASMASALFRRAEDDSWANFGTSDAPGGDTGGGWLPTLVGSVVLVAVVVLAGWAYISIRSRYKGYSRTASELPSDDYGLQSARDTMGEKRILM